MDPDFFPYHPRKLRLGLLVGVLIASALTVWAVIAFLGSQAPRDILRAGLSGGLAAAMGLTWYRYRPKDGWGVRVTPLSVLVSRPRGGLIEVPWESVKDVRRLGDKRDTIGLWLDENQRVLVPAHLFARVETFEALATRIDEKRPVASKQGVAVN